MTDIELAALAELVATHRFGMEAENQMRVTQGYGPAYTEDVEWPERDKLEAELKRRKIID